MPSAHAKLSPSSAERWISCPASVRAIAENCVQDNTDSIYAREGTLAHALGEIEAAHTFGLSSRTAYLKARKAWGHEFNAENYPEGTLNEMREHVKGYVRFIAERLRRRPGSRVQLEQRLDTGVPGSWGTSDVVIFSPNHIEIIDLKYGAGVPVSAWDNPQLRLYACGALDTYGDILGDTEDVFITVYQPRVDNNSTEHMTAAALREWRETVAIPAALETRNPDAPFGPSAAACRWCPLAGICRARMEKSVSEDFGKPADVLSPEELGEVLHRLPGISAWTKAVEKAALDLAWTKETPIPGWKVVLSGGKRNIPDATAAIQTLIDNGYPAEKVADFKVKPLGELEKLVGKKELPGILGDLLVKSSGRESLVPESAPGAAITPAGQAAADFTEEPAA